jgi:hypothetical protein
MRGIVVLRLVNERHRHELVTGIYDVKLVMTTHIAAIAPTEHLVGVCYCTILDVIHISYVNKLG